MTQVIDTAKVGKKGHPRHFEALGIDPPMREALPGEVGGPPVLSTPPTKAQLKAYAANARWMKEAGGITVGDISVGTDDRSKTMITGAYVQALADANFETLWKTAIGSFVTIGSAAVITMGNAVSAHVAACFALEAQIIAAIDADSITTTAQVDAAFAPQQED